MEIDRETGRYGRVISFSALLVLSGVMHTASTDLLRTCAGIVPVWPHGEGKSKQTATGATCRFSCCCMVALVAQHYRFVQIGTAQCRPDLPVDHRTVNHSKGLKNHKDGVFFGLTGS